MTSPNELRFAVVSDLHCHHSSQGTAKTLLLSDADRSPSSQHPVEALLDLIKVASLQADILLMPGDITNEVDQQGMISGWGFIQEIANALHASCIAPTLGNHDVISRKPSDDAFKHARRLRSPTFPSTNDQAFDQFWSKGFFALDGQQWRVLAVNSVASHTTEESAKQGLVTNHQLAAIQSFLSATTPKAVQVAVCHHHPLLHEDIGLGKSDVMENGSLLIETLSEHGFCLLVHGHKHHPKLTYSSGSTPLPILASGSFSAGMKNGLASRTRNVFHLVTVNVPQRIGEPVTGRIETWQFRQWKGWSPATWEAVDFPHITGFGCFEHADVLAARVENAYRRRNVSFARWADVIQNIPEITMIPPAVFEAVGERLKKGGVDLQPFPPNEPRYIGVPQ
jgi:UDP-2,3-diacylglucosamine pyrophosphatase LpxH